MLFWIVTQSKIYFPKQNQFEEEQTEILKNIFLNKNKKNSNQSQQQRQQLTSSNNDNIGNNNNNNDNHLNINIDSSLLSTSLKKSASVTSSTSSLKILANVTCHEDNNEKRNLQQQRRRKLHINNYLTKMRKKSKKNRTRSDK